MAKAPAQIRLRSACASERGPVGRASVVVACVVEPRRGGGVRSAVEPEAGPLWRWPAALTVGQLSHASNPAVVKTSVKALGRARGHPDDSPFSFQQSAAAPAESKKEVAHITGGERRQIRQQTESGGDGSAHGNSSTVAGRGASADRSTPRARKRRPAGSSQFPAGFGQCGPEAHRPADRNRRHTHGPTDVRVP